MDPRRQKANELADRARITFAGGCWSVPSQGGNGRYTVLIEGSDAACDCPDFELRDKPCKHILAVRLLIAREKRGVEQDRDNHEPAPKVKRRTYPQRWNEYNAGQVNEQTHFPELLADLCRTVEEPPRTGRGRRPIPLADQAFAATMKVYSLFSARRFMGELELAVERGHVSRGMHFNSVLNALENPALTSVFHRLIQQSSLPLRTVDTVFAPDSSGFCTSRFIRWFDVKYGVTRETAEWVKVHLMTGTKTNIVTAAAILGRDAADGPQLPGLLETTAKGFTVKEVAADKAYTSVSNCDAVDAVGGTLFAPFKTNMTGAAGGVFEKMFHYFALRREEFLRHYHARSNVESTFSMMKRKFGDAVRSKTETAMTNEVLGKILAHNLCCLIAAWYELGIEPAFGGQPEEGPAVLRFARPG